MQSQKDIRSLAEKCIELNEYAAKKITDHLNMAIIGIMYQKYNGEIHECFLKKHYVYCEAIDKIESIANDEQKDRIIFYLEGLYESLQGSNCLKAIRRETGSFLGSKQKVLNGLKQMLVDEKERWFERSKAIKEKINEESEKVFDIDMLFLRDYLLADRENCFVDVRVRDARINEEYPNIFDLYEKNYLFEKNNSLRTSESVKEILKYKPYYRTVVKYVALGVSGYYRNSDNTVLVKRVGSVEFDGKTRKLSETGSEFRKIFFPNGTVHFNLLIRPNNSYDNALVTGLLETKGLWLERI